MRDIRMELELICFVLLIIVACCLGLLTLVHFGGYQI